MRMLTKDRNRGVAMVEFAILLVVFIPLIIAAIDWTVRFSERSDETMRALAAISACLIDPVLIYEYQGGKLVVRQDAASLLNEILSSCSAASEGLTTCGFLIDPSGDMVLNDATNDPADECSTLDIAACYGTANPPPGVLVAMIPKEGEPVCQHYSELDPGGDVEEAEETVPEDFGICYWGGSSYYYNFVACNDNGDGTATVHCCAPNTKWNNVTEKCEGCANYMGGIECDMGGNLVCMDYGYSPTGECCSLTEASPGQNCYANTQSVCDGLCCTTASCPAQPWYEYGNTCFDPTPIGSCGCNPEESHGAVAGIANCINSDSEVVRFSPRPDPNDPYGYEEVTPDALYECPESLPVDPPPPGMC